MAGPIHGQTGTNGGAGSILDDTFNPKDYFESMLEAKGLKVKRVQ